MSSASRIVFAGTPDFAVPFLRMLLSTGVDVPVVLTQPDRPVGRGRKLAQSPVKREALAYGLEVCQPAELATGALGKFRETAPDLLVVVAYGLLLPSWLIDWPSLGAINVHASLLPRWRGAAPIQHAILAGDTETGACVMKIDSGLDTGPVYSCRSLAIGPEENASALHGRLAQLGSELLRDSLPRILENTLSPVPQNNVGATYAPKIGKKDALLNWRQSATELARHVRAFNPWPVSETITDDGKRVRVWEAIVLKEGCTESPGTVIAANKQGIKVATGEGVLRILSLQQPGGNVMKAQAYLNAHSLEGTVFVC